MCDNNISFEYQNNCMTAYIIGDIDHHRARGLREVMDKRLYSDRPALFVINMSRVSFMDSSGLGLILGRFTLCRELDIEFKLSQPSDEVQKILDLAGTHRLIHIEKNKTDKKL